MRDFLILLVGFILVSCQPSYADSWSDSLDRELRVGFLGWSEHYMKTDITNESHNILAVEYMGFSAGKFDNSYDRETWFIAKNFRLEGLGGFEHVNGIAAIGVNRGYRECYGDDGSGPTYCAHGYIGLEYDKHTLVHSVKFQPGVFLYNPEIRFSW